MMILFPLSVLSVLLGHFFLLRKVENIDDERSTSSNDMVALVKLLLPLIVIIAVYTSIRMLFPAVNQLNRYLPMVIGILAAQIALQFQRPLGLKQWGEVLVTVTTINMAMVVTLALIYGAFIEARLPGGSFLMSEVRGELGMLGIPVVMVIFLVPFICGLTTGITIGFVGASFPIVLSLIGNGQDTSMLLSVSVLAYGSGYMGVILSPVHVCLIVTNEHFKTSLTQSLFRLLKPALVMIAFSFLLYVIINLF
jgi:hypothetical protein